MTGKKENKVQSSTEKDETSKVDEKAGMEPSTTTTDKESIKSPAKAKTDTVTSQSTYNDKKEDEPMATEVSTTTNISTVEESKPESPRTKKELQKKQTPEPAMFAEKDLLVSSTPAKPIAGTKALSNQKKISKSSESVNATTLSEVKTYPLDRSSCPTSYKNISGRRSLRPMKDYVFQHTSNNSFRESYRKINTELDVENMSNNTSLNVTVGSEIPSNWSFSFLGRSRKRDRTPTHFDTETVNDMDTSPTSPKRPRFDFAGFVGILSSPVTMLRERLARTKIQNTPHKLRTSEEDITEVANVSSVQIDENEPAVKEDDIQVQEEDIDAIKEQNKENIAENDGGDQEQPSIGEDALDSDEGESDVRETEPRKKGCVLM